MKKTRTAAVKKDAAGNGGQAVYIGPTIRNVITAGTVFNNGLPDRLQKMTETVPAVKSLIVPLDRLAEVQKELKKTGSALQVIYQTIKKEHGGIK